MASSALSRVAYLPSERPGAGRLGAVARLRLSWFRSYPELSLETDGRPVVLVGENGAGKTNLLEAVSLLGPGRGLRGVPLGALAHVPAGAADAVVRPWAVAARVTTADGEVDLGTGQEPEGGERRVARIDGAGESVSALSRHLRLLWLTPAMDRLLVEAASGRRRFLDRLTLSLDPAHAARSSGYDRAMRERNRLLRDGPRDPAWLSGLEAELARLGVEIAAARLATVRALAAQITRVELDEFPRALMALEGGLEEALARGEAPETVEAVFLAALQRGRGRDQAAGRMLEGPHTSDLAVTHAATGRAAALCSTGEQKALLIGLILAQARLVAAAAPGAGPVVLLDEIAAHLDERRREALFDALSAQGVQAWLTGTDGAVFAPLGARAQLFVVADGTVRPT